MAGNVRAVFEYMGIATYLDLDHNLKESLAAPSQTRRAGQGGPQGRGKTPGPSGEICPERGRAEVLRPAPHPRPGPSGPFPGIGPWGFDWKVCKLDLLRKLVVHGLITTIEISRPEFVSARHALLDLTRTILSGILLKRSRPELKQGLRRTRGGPDRLGPRLHRPAGDRAAMASALRRRAVWAANLRTSIEEECAARTRSLPGGDLRRGHPDPGLQPPGRGGRDETALLLALGGADLVGTAADVVYSYARRLEIAREHLCLMLMEFIQLAEKSFLTNLAERELFVRSHPEELERMLAEEAFRDRLRERAVQRNELMLLRMDFTGTVMDPSDPAVTRITVRNRGSSATPRAWKPWDAGPVRSRRTPWTRS
ncbi:MAG: hypothetical protein MZU79_00325 [Anaerotruncus sp.]|nr:hypothetical protein [Anaerotruncus sp.]